MVAPIPPQWALDAHRKLQILKEPYQIARTRIAPTSSQDEEKLMPGSSLVDSKQTTTAATTTFFVLSHRMDWERVDGPPLLVRDEYDSIYAYITTDSFANQSLEGPPAGGLCVWGHPGIGKSAFLRYALARALYEGQPVLFIHKQSQYVFFDDDGPHVIIGDFYSKVELISMKYPGVLVLVDSGHQLVTLPADLSTLPFRIVQASSPHEAHYREWIKQRKGNVWVMDPWTDEELMNAWSTMDPTSYSPIEHAQWAGNVPRSVLDKDTLNAAPATYFKEQRAELLNIVKVTNLTALAVFFASKQFPQERGFHRFFVVSRDLDANHHPAFFFFGPAAWAKVECISPIVEAYLRAYFVQRDILETLTFASNCDSTPQVAGVLYEAAAIRILARQPEFSQQWSGQVYKSGDAEPFTLPVTPSSEIELELVIPASGPVDSSTRTLKFNQVYVPEAGYPTLNALVANDSSMLLLQMTIAKVREIKAAGITRLLNAVPRNMQSLEWRFLFVVPSHEVGQMVITKQLAEGVTYQRKKVYFGYVVFAFNGHDKELQTCSDALLSHLKGV